MSDWLHAFLAAVQFLTRLPAPGGMNRPGADAALLGRAVVFFPLVGGLVGALTGVVLWSGGLLWPPAAAVVLGLAFEAVLTGAFHEDAVADCCDAFGGGWSREDVLRILKDSRVGSYGALGLTLAVLLRAACLAALDPAHLVAASAASAGLGRWAAVLVMAAAPPAADRAGLGRDVGGRVGPAALAGATVLAAAAAGWYAMLEPVRLACGAAAVVAGSLWWAGYVRRRIGGTTGDCLGFACYLGQLLLLLAAVAGAPWRGGAGGLQ
jgi:adenosylcobinamide-GDP ribazoletransferase